MEEPEEHASAEPEHHHSRERHSPRAYLTPYAPEPEEEAAHRSRSVTAALLAVALVVAVGAGGTLYAVLGDGPQAAPTAPSAPVSP
ncbi:hypothetical protein OG426_29650 [Streptomyces canus]|uniref:hypothetical protein n=1 Tax=Streptomyces canus TaxID=58343 RepID=UPI00224DF868|nr:hypothetical protein [Streptomyces canus]MCX4858476.1 hypothetical protein [Streptomyces canus]WSW36312.1 hypothetical protein OG426_29650 [Streptomyces canus]